MSKNKKLRVVIPGRLENARIGYEHWTIKGKKKRIIVIRDSKGRKLARSYKVKNLEQAKDKFISRGTLVNNYRVHYTTNTKEYTKVFKYKNQAKGKSSRQFQAYSYTFVKKGNKMVRIDATSRYYDAGTDYKTALDDSYDRLASRVDGEINMGTSDSPYVDRGKKTIIKNGNEVYYGIIWRSKR